MPPVGKTVMGGEGALDPLFLNAPPQEVLDANAEKAINDELGRLRAEAGKISRRSQEENRRWTALSRRSPFTSIWEKQMAEITNVGLQNPGALCYRNVVLQIIAHCPAIYHWCWFYKEHHIPQGEVCFKGEQQSVCKMCLLNDFLEHYWDDSLTGNFQDKVDELWDIVFVDWAKEQKEGQQDPAELFMEMIHQFAAEVPEALRRDWQEICNSEFTTARLCKGTRPCEKVRYKSQPDKSDGWPVFSIQFGEKSNAANIQQAFEEHMNDTTAMGKCKDCGGENFEKEYFTKPPEVLVLQLNRAGEDGQKIDRRLKWSEKLKIHTDYFDPRSNVAAASNIEYELTSVVFHAGETTSSGHYTVMVKGRTGKWTLLDDDKIAAANYPAFGPDNKQQQEAYMFVYTRLPIRATEEKWTRYNNMSNREILKKRPRPRSASPTGSDSDSNKKPKTMLDWSQTHRNRKKYDDGETWDSGAESEDPLEPEPKPAPRPHIFEPESKNNLAIQKQLEETQKQLKLMQEQWELDRAKLRESQDRIRETQDRLEQSLNRHAQIVTIHEHQPGKGPDAVSSYSLISADQLDGAFDRALQRWQQENEGSGDVKASSVAAYEKRLEEAIKRLEKIQPANSVSVSGSIDSSDLQEAVGRAMLDWYEDHQPVVKINQPEGPETNNISDVRNLIQDIALGISDQNSAFRAHFASKTEISDEIKQAMKSWQQSDGKEFLKSVQRAVGTNTNTNTGTGSTQATTSSPFDLDGTPMTKKNFKMPPHTGARAFDNKTGFLRVQYFEYHNGSDKNPNPNKEYKIPLDFAVRGYPINLKENKMESGLNATFQSLIRRQKSTNKIITIDGDNNDGDSSDVESNE